MINVKVYISLLYAFQFNVVLDNYRYVVVIAGAECNMGNIFRVPHILQLMRNEENICQYCTRQCVITTLSLNACLNQMNQELSYVFTNFIELA